MLQTRVRDARHHRAPRRRRVRRAAGGLHARAGDRASPKACARRSATSASCGAARAVGRREHRHRADHAPRPTNVAERHERGRHRLLRRQGRRPQPRPRLRGSDGVSHRHREMQWVARIDARRRGRPARAVLPAHRAARGADTGDARVPRARCCACARTTARWCRPASSCRPPSATTSCRASIAGWWARAVELLRERQRRGQPLPLRGGQPVGHVAQRRSRSLDFVLQSVADPAHRAAQLCFEITETAAVTNLVERALSS